MERTAVWCVAGAGIIAYGLVKAVRSWRALMRRLDIVNQQNARILIALEYFKLPPDETNP